MLRILRRLLANRVINFTYNVNLINKLKYFVMSSRLRNPEAIKQGIALVNRSQL